VRMDSADRTPEPSQIPATPPEPATAPPAAPARAQNPSTGTVPEAAVAASPVEQKGSHAGLIAGSIAGGVLLLALAFGGGTAFGWALGLGHESGVSAEDRPGLPDGRAGQDGSRPGPGQDRDRGPGPWSNDDRGDRSTPDPTPSPTT
jgi:hypothetical protein